MPAKPSDSTRPVLNDTGRTTQKCICPAPNAYRLPKGGSGHTNLTSPSRKALLPGLRKTHSNFINASFVPSRLHVVSPNSKKKRESSGDPFQVRPPPQKLPDPCRTWRTKKNFTVAASSHCTSIAGIILFIVHTSSESGARLDDGPSFPGNAPASERRRQR